MALPEDIVNSLPEEYRDNPIVKDSNDVASVVKMAIDSQKELGSRIRVPGPDADAEALTAFQKDLMSKVNGLTMVPGEGATDDQKNLFFEQIGRPKSANAYSIDNLNLPQGLPEDYKLPQEQLDSFKEFAFKNNLTQAQFASSLEAELNAVAGQHKSIQETAAEKAERLDQQFGAAKDAKLNAARRAAEKFGGKEFADSLISSGDPEALAAWSKAGESFSEQGTIDLTSTSPQTGGLSPDEASRRSNEIWSNKDHPFHKRQNPGHNEAVFEMFNLTRQKMGQKALTRSQYDEQLGIGGKFNSSSLGSVAVAQVGE